MSKKKSKKRKINIQQLWAPNKIYNEPDSIRVNDKFHSIISLERMPDRISYNQIKKFVKDGNDLKPDFSLFINPYSRKDAQDKIMREIGEIRSEMGTEKNEGRIDRMSVDLDKLNRLKDDIVNEKLSLFDMSLILDIKDENVEGCKNKESRIRELFSNFEWDNLVYKMKNAIKSVLPLGTNYTGTSVPVHTDNITAFYPFVSDYTLERGGIYLGKDIYTGLPFSVNIWEKGHYDRLVFGQKGSGKSFLTKLMIIREKLQNPELPVMIVDPVENPDGGGEYGDLVTVLDGEIIDLSTHGTKNVINPLDPTLSKNLEEAVDDAITLFSTSFNMNGEERALFNTVLSNLYRKCTEYDRDGKLNIETMPTIKNLIWAFEDIYKDKNHLFDLKVSDYEKYLKYNRVGTKLKRVFTNGFMFELDFSEYDELIEKHLFSLESSDYEMYLKEGDIDEVFLFQMDRSEYIEVFQGDADVSKLEDKFEEEDFGIEGELEIFEMNRVSNVGNSQITSGKSGDWVITVDNKRKYHVVEDLNRLLVYGDELRNVFEEKGHGIGIGKDVSIISQQRDEYLISVDGLFKYRIVKDDNLLHVYLKKGPVPPKLLAKFEDVGCSLAKGTEYDGDINDRNRVYIGDEKKYYLYIDRREKRIRVHRSQNFEFENHYEIYPRVKKDTWVITDDKEIVYTVEKDDDMYMVFKNETPESNDAFNSKSDIAQKLKIKLRPYVTGAYSILDNKTNVKLDNDVVSFNVSNVPESHRPFFMTLVLKYIWRETAKSYTPKMVVGDEAQLLMDLEMTAEFLERYVRVVRRYHASTLLISQSVMDFMGAKHGDKILENTMMHFLLYHEHLKDNVKDFYGLSEKETDIITTPQIGRSFVKVGRKRIFLNVDATDAEHEVITTDPNEIRKKFENK